MITQDQIKEARAEMEAAKERLSNLKQAYAEQECPLRIGQIIDCLGNSHRGKRMMVTAIHPAQFRFNGAWRVTGPVLKKDGSAGERYAEVSQSQWEKANAD